MLDLIKEDMLDLIKEDILDLSCSRFSQIQDENSIPDKH